MGMQVLPEEPEGIKSMYIISNDNCDVVVYLGEDEPKLPHDAIGCYRIDTDEGVVEEWADGDWHEIDRVFSLDMLDRLFGR